MTPRIRPASADETALVRELFTEYAAGLGHDLCFQNFAQELATLPGAYAPPRGRLLLAEVDGAAAGCVALRPLGDDRCEMKRLYVRSAHRGVGLGRMLAEAILDEARRAGYRAIVLDTLPTMETAITLYRSLGFRPTAPYCHNPIEGAVFLERDLT
jgi:ribosomal protein S18 acetylase RimI-like enzyme